MPGTSDLHRRTRIPFAASLVRRVPPSERGSKRVAVRAEEPQVLSPQIIPHAVDVIEFYRNGIATPRRPATFRATALQNAFTKEPPGEPLGVLEIAVLDEDCVERAAGPEIRARLTRQVGASDKVRDVDVEAAGVLVEGLVVVAAAVEVQPHERASDRA